MSLPNFDTYHRRFPGAAPPLVPGGRIDQRYRFRSSLH